MVGIIDYGSGNLKSVYNAFKYIGEDVKVCQNSKDIDSSSKIVLPGVGSIKDAMKELEKKDMISVIKKNIFDGKIFLGICLGLQMLFERSEESDGCNGLALEKGEVKLFPGGGQMKVPQIGWNTVKLAKKDCPIFEGIEDESYFYFVHSYYCLNKETELDSGMTEYGVNYTSALWKDNVYALQFHPERSQEKGLKILRNFCKL